MGLVMDLFERLQDIIQAIRYNRKKHIPVAVFMGGVERRWGHPFDQNSRAWLQTSPIIVDLLHQMLSGQLVAGDKKIEYDVNLLLLDKMFPAVVLFSKDVDQSILKRDDAFEHLWDKFHESHPDAATLVSYAYQAFWRSS
jgi:hypothetical protein